MKKSYLFAALAIAATLVSCNKETAPVELTPDSREGYVELTLSASVDADTKAVLDGKKVVWEVGEELAVYTENTFGSNKFTVVSVEGNEVMISGSVPEGANGFIAVYPYGSALSYNSGTVRMALPSEQTIGEGQVVAPDALASVAYFTDASTKGQFKNVFSLLAFQVSEAEDVDGAIFGSSMEKSSDNGNEITVEVSTGADPVVSNSLGGFAVTVSVPGGVKAGETYYAVVPPTEEVSGFYAGPCQGSKAAKRTSEKTFSLKRNNGFNLGDLVAEGAVYKFFQIADCYELKAFLEEASAYAEGDKVEIVADIDMLDVDITTAESFAGVLEGNEFQIKNWSSNGVALFGVVTGEIRNLTLASSCDLTGCPVGRFGFMVRALEGKMVNCHNKADVSFHLTGDESQDPENAPDATGIASRQFGALVGRMTNHNAQMIECSNSGEITVSTEINDDMQGALYIGGLVGLVGDPGDEVVVRLQGCYNTGNITVKPVLGTEGQTWLSSHFIGGVAGATGVNKGTSKTQETNYTKYYGEIRECSNKGDITTTWGGGTGGYFKLGGIIGYSEAALFDCLNEGSVSYTNSNEVSNAGPSVGGITAVLAGTAAINAKDCVNRGDVTLSGMFSNAGNAFAGGCAGSAWATAGGCFGTIGDNSTKVVDCYNYGDVNVDTYMAAENGSSSAFGGFAGVSMAEIDGCCNFGGQTNLSGMTKNCHMGGIVGYAYKPVSNCDVKSDIVFKHDISSLTKNKASCYNNVGGIVGYSYNEAPVSNCSVAGSIEVSASAELRLGGIVGMLYNAVSDCSNSADITLKRIDISTDYKSYIGGCVGLLNANFAATGCSNSGSFDVTMDPHTQYSYIGGIVGYTKGSSVTESSNEGSIVFDGAEMVKQMAIGGIIGWGNIALTVTDCTNSGDITVDNWSNTAYNYIAGIYACYNKAGNVYVNCHNSGNITSTATSKMRLGGIGASINTGAGVYVDNCSNTGNISATNALAASQIGGIAGYWGQGNMSNCLNTGAVSLEAAGVSYAGAMIGALNVDSKWNDVEVAGSVEANAGMYTGALIGGFSAANKTLTLEGSNTFTATVNGEDFSEDNAAGNLNGGSVTGL